MAVSHTKFGAMPLDKPLAYETVDVVCLCGMSADDFTME